jgi:hypothetical protein
LSRKVSEIISSTERIAFSQSSQPVDLDQGASLKYNNFKKLFLDGGTIQWHTILNRLKMLAEG